MKGRLLALARKELLQLRRDKLTLGMMVALPIVQLILFGYAINTDVRHLPTVVYDQDGSPRSRELVETLQASGTYDIVGHVRSYDDIVQAMRRNDARVCVVIPPRFQATILRNEPAQVQLVIDGSDPQTVASASTTASAILQARSIGTLVQQAGAPGVPLSAEPVMWFNPELRTAVFVVPGLIGVILTMTMVMLTSMAIARERERGTLELLIVTPIRSSELIAGKILPYIGIGYVQMTLVLLLGRIIFRVPIVGNLLLLYALAFTFIAANLALGLFFSTLAKTQQQAMQMSFFFLLPNILLSGFMFPREGMPHPAQLISLVLPLTHFLNIVRGVTLKGSGFTDLVPSFLSLLAILTVLVVLTRARFSKRLS